MKNQLELRNHLKTIRMEKSLSQDELAQLVGVSRQTISSIETGQFNPLNIGVHACPPDVLILMGFVGIRSNSS